MAYVPGILPSAPNITAPMLFSYTLPLGKEVSLSISLHHDAPGNATLALEKSQSVDKDTKALFEFDQLADKNGVFASNDVAYDATSPNSTLVNLPAPSAAPLTQPAADSALPDTNLTSTVTTPVPTAEILVVPPPSPPHFGPRCIPVEDTHVNDDFCLFWNLMPHKKSIEEMITCPPPKPELPREIMLWVFRMYNADFRGPWNGTGQLWGVTWDYKNVNFDGPIDIIDLPVTMSPVFIEPVTAGCGDRAESDYPTRLAGAATVTIALAPSGHVVPRLEMFAFAKWLFYLAVLLVPCHYRVMRTTYARLIGKLVDTVTPFIDIPVPVLTLVAALTLCMDNLVLYLNKKRRPTLAGAPVQEDIVLELPGLSVDRAVLGVALITDPDTGAVLIQQVSFDPRAACSHRIILVRSQAMEFEQDEEAETDDSDTDEIASEETFEWEDEEEDIAMQVPVIIITDFDADVVIHRGNWTSCPDVGTVVGLATDSEPIIMPLPTIVITNFDADSIADPVIDFVADPVPPGSSVTITSITTAVSAPFEATLDAKVEQELSEDPVAVDPVPVAADVNTDADSFADDVPVSKSSITPTDAVSIEATPIVAVERESQEEHAPVELPDVAVYMLKVSSTIVAEAVPTTVLTITFGSVSVIAELNAGTQPGHISVPELSIESAVTAVICRIEPVPVSVVSPVTLSIAAANKPTTSAIPFPVPQTLGMKVNMAWHRREDASSGDTLGQCKINAGMYPVLDEMEWTQLIRLKDESLKAAGVHDLCIRRDTCFVCSGVSGERYSSSILWAASSLFHPK
ncbi:hypothetical protein BOTBODRAFT_193168 [Botryobasidium botryosum FD-172 SS1]|uniref:Uncharacterized protein n=1 Tax=Botryobasidium botryosum (strain FD-172 SS1) TaxID=930990 RepID=A0A067M2U3_BOTB1|nr:hypothetical protein BOTBODRAFT_193168 [Botryobasidium botryosum FD-172 SS1]